MTFSWNIEGVEKHILALEYLLSKFKPDIWCLQETKCPQVYESNLQNTFPFFITKLNSQENHNQFVPRLLNSRNVQHCGTSLSIAKKYRKVNRFLISNDSRITSSKVMINDQDILSISAYFPTDGDNECQAKFEEFVTFRNL